jgi:hypothetical protein
MPKLYFYYFLKQSAGKDTKPATKRPPLFPQNRFANIPAIHEINNAPTNECVYSA